MKVKYNGKGTFTTSGMEFRSGDEKEVSEEIGDYLISTFDFDSFKVEPEVVIPETKEEVKSEPKKRKSRQPK